MVAKVVGEHAKFISKLKALLKTWPRCKEEMLVDTLIFSQDSEMSTFKHSKPVKYWLYALFRPLSSLALCIKLSFWIHYILA